MGTLRFFFLNSEHTFVRSQIADATPRFTTRACSGISKPLSFQRLLVPLLHAITDQRVSDSTLQVRAQTPRLNLPCLNLSIPSLRTADRAKPPGCHFVRL